MFSVAKLTNGEQVFNILMKDVIHYADNVGIDIVVPRISFKQILRTNNPIDYYTISVFLLYLDLITSSLKYQIREKNEDIFFSLKKDSTRRNYSTSSSEYDILWRICG